MLLGAILPMKIPKKPPLWSRWLHRSSRILFILVCLSIYLMGLTVFSSQALALTRSMPGGRVSDPVVRQVDIARPAIVRIITTINAKLTVRFTSNSAPVTFPQHDDHYPLRLGGSG